MDRYMTIALTGNRLAGKNSVGELFKKIGVPVFDADAVLKYLLNYHKGTAEAVKRCFGESYVIGGYANPIAFDTDEKLDRLISIVDFAVFSAYKKFHEKYRKHAQYTVFNCGCIFEKKWEDRFDYVINVSCPPTEREYRYEMLNTDLNPGVFRNEISDIGKNRKSDYVIFNQEIGPDVKNKVIQIDSELSEIYFLRKDKNYKKRRTIEVGDSIDIRTLTT